MTDEEKNLYNLHLKISRSIKGEPYQIRKKFDGFETDVKYPYLQKLVLFFNKYNNLKIESFLKAPYVIFKDETYFPLEFYLTQKAVKAYRLYNNYLLNLNPDTDEQLEFIKESLHFIKEYCKSQNKKVEDYLYYKEPGSSVFTWEIHIKDHKISVYVMFGLDNFQSVLYSIPKDEQELFVEDVIKYFASFKIKYEQSAYAKLLVIKGLKLISNYS